MGGTSTLTLIDPNHQWAQSRNLLFVSLQGGFIMTCSLLMEQASILIAEATMMRDKTKAGHQFS